MPGNEVGDRIHNFFGQENLSQGQQHPDVVDGTWEGLDNNQWIGSQRQISRPFISSLKNHSIQQSAESERVNGGQSSGMQPGVNFSRSISRPEFAITQSQNQQPTLNGYMHGNQVFQTRQNQPNLLGVELDSNRSDLASRGFSILDAQMGSGPEHQKKNLVRTDFNESPVNFDFLGCQQQLSSQHPGVFQSIRGQRSGNNDMQMLQQQAMFRQMQEIQRQQQLQKQQMEQQEGRQMNSLYQVSSLSKQASGSLSSAMLNGIPIHDASNYPWQPEHMTANANWPQRGIFPAIQGSSSGPMFSPEQDQTPQMAGMIPQQVDESLYGVPISGARSAANQYSPILMDKSTLQHISGSSNSFSGNRHNGFPDQASLQNSSFVSRQGYQGKSMMGPPDSQGLNSGFQQIDLRQSNDPGQDFHGRQDLVGPSEPSQDKTVMQVSSSENVATLDPTEEKILYGSDDNLWEAFGGGMNMGSGSYNMLEGGHAFGALPSVQSGSWSALMQSAVAETSSADVGLQEDWCGPTYRSSEPPPRNQVAPSIVDSGKQQSCWADSRSQAGALPNVSSYNLSDSNNTNVNYSNMAGVKQSGMSVSHEQIEIPHASQRFVQPFLEERTKWLDHKPQEIPVSEGSHNDDKVPHSSDADPNAKSISGAVLRNQGNETSLQASQATERKSPMFDAIGYGAGSWKTSSVSNSLVEVEHATSTSRSQQVNGESSNVNNVALLPGSSNVRSNQENIQQLPNGNNIDIWKHVNSSVSSKGREFLGNFKSHMDKSHQMFESSGNSGLGNGVPESHDYPDSKETKHTKFHNVLQPTSSSGGRENARLDTNDLSGGRQLSSSHISRKPSGVRKFQYHPMGDLDTDVEHSYGMRHVTQSQTMPTQVSQGFKGYNYGGVGQSNFPAQMSRNSMEIEKGQFPGFQGETNKPDEIALKNRLSGSMASTSTSSDLPVHSYATSKTLPASQNMLELLHKVDQSRDHGNAVQFSSSDCNQSSEMHEANGSAVSVPQNQSSTSQGFGLQLAPPSQPFPVRDHAFPSQGVPQTVNSPSQEASQGESRNSVSGTTRHAGKSPQGNYSAGFPPGFPHARNHLQNQQMYDMVGQATNSQPANVYFNRFVSQSKQTSESLERAKSGLSSLASLPDICSASQSNAASSGEMPQLKINNQNTAKDSSQQFPILESVPANQGLIVSGTLPEKATGQVSPAFWTSISAQVSSNMLTSNLQLNNDSQILSRPQKLGHSPHLTETGPSEPGVGSGNSRGYIAKDLSGKGDQSQQLTSDNDPAQKTMSTSQEKESVANCVLGTPTSDSNSTQREIEAFGRSLRPNNILHQNYSRMHQFQGIQNVEVDPGNRSLKRFKGPDDVGDNHQVGLHLVYGQNDAVRDATTNCTSVDTGDSKLLNLSAKSTNSQDTNISAQDIYTVSRDDSQDFAGGNAAYSRTNHSQISPQMAPSWFDQYGTLKNGQILPIQDVPKPAALKSMEAPFTVERPSNSLYADGPVEQGSAIATDSHHGLHKGSPSLIASENLASSRLMNEDAATVSLATLKSKKRKTATSELVPWHKEVVHGCPMLNISAAELDWSRAANRSSENVEDEVEMFEDAIPVFRSKRRLVLTTQLMQLLFRPPLASVFSADAKSHYESFVHFLARSTLGDTCSTLPCAGNYNSMPSSSGNTVPEKTSERIRDQYFSKVMEDLSSRARKVENDILRLDKRTSAMDLRVECQELERYSIINHFAKFHSSREYPSTSPSDGSTNYRKTGLVRYVTALPMPKNLPDSVQCFSL